MDRISALISAKTALPFGFCAFKGLRLLECSAKKRLPPNPKSVVVFLLPYNTVSSVSGLAKFAGLPDYHTVFGAILNDISASLKSAFPDGDYVSFCDNSPIPEKYAAVLAGLGFIGKNGLLINETHGSWVFIGEIVTSLVIPPSNAATGSCGDCTACLDACPGSALNPGSAIGGSHFTVECCVSHITQKKRTLSAEEEALVAKSGYFWGCDICEIVCPRNQTVALSQLPAFLEPFDYVSFTDEAMSRRYPFGYKGLAVLNRNREILRKNG